MMFRRNLSLCFVFFLFVGACSEPSNQVEGTTGSGRSDSTTQEAATTGADKGTGAQTDVGIEPKSGWGTPQTVGKRVNEFGGEMSAPSVAMNDQGQAIAAWSAWNEDADPPSPHLFVSIYQNHAWQPYVKLVDHFAKDADVAINARGDMIVSYVRVVHQPSGLGWSEEAWARRYVDGAWQKPERVGFESPSEALHSTYVGALQVKLSDTGIAFMVWRQSDTRTPAVHQGLFARSFGPVAWNQTLKLDHRLPSYVDTFWMDMNAEGDGAVLWLDAPEASSGELDLSRSVVWGKAFGANGWRNSYQLSTTAKDASVKHASPRVVVDHNGQAHALFAEGAADKQIGSKVYLARLRKQDEVWTSPEVMFENASTALAFENGIAVSEQGVLALGWRADSLTTPEHSSTFVRVYDLAKDTWDGPFELSSHDSGVQTAPFVSVDRRGKVWAAWRQSDANPEASIHVRSYDPGLGLGQVQTPANGESLDMAGNAQGQVLLGTRHHYVSQSPLGYYSAPTATLYTP